jgi:RluA family pseudouridine synthase
MGKTRELLSGLGEAHSAFVTTALLRRHGVDPRLIDLSGWRDDREMTLEERIKDGLSDVDFANEMPIVTGYAQCSEGLMAEFDRGYVRRGILPVRPGRIVRGGEQYGHLFPDTVEPDVATDIQIVWEDEALVAIAKPAPLPMHPCGRFNRNTLTQLLSAVYAPEVLRPAHRLDANTSGVVLFSRTRSFAQQIQTQFDATLVEKVYRVVCHGHPEADAFSCRQPIGRQRGQAGTRILDPQGLAAETEFCVLQRRSDGTSLLEARPRTGRTNQIRVHLWGLGHPVVGDPLYRSAQQLGESQTLAVGDDPMRLHAWRLTLTHPLSQEPITFTAELPAGFDAGEPTSAQTVQG